MNVLGSFIFGLATDRRETFDATVSLAQRAEVTLAQFGILQPFPGTVDFQKWEQSVKEPERVGSVPLTRYWLIPQAQRPKLYTGHPLMSATEIRERTQQAWDRFYSLRLIWVRAQRLPWKARVVFVLMSKLYRQMYANTGIATDSARVKAAAGWARWLATRSLRLFRAAPMPDLQPPRGVGAYSKAAPSAGGASGVLS